MDYSMLLYVHLCNVDKIKYKTIEKDFYERFIRMYLHRYIIGRI